MINQHNEIVGFFFADHYAKIYRDPHMNSDLNKHRKRKNATKNHIKTFKDSTRRSHNTFSD